LNRGLTELSPESSTVEDLVEETGEHIYLRFYGNGADEYPGYSQVVQITGTAKYQRQCKFFIDADERLSGTRIIRQLVGIQQK
jgi:hypothetical protein